MKINIVGKNISVTQGLQEKITKKLSALNKYIIIDDEDVANALHEGEVRGKNIKHQKNLELRKKGDGVADLDSATAESSQNGDNQPDFGALGRMARGGSIWERGGEKRIRNR